VYFYMFFVTTITINIFNSSTKYYQMTFK